MRSVIIETVEGASRAKTPVRATPGSACFDIYAIEETELTVGKVTLVRTGLKMRAPKETFVEIRPRSGLSTKGVLMVNAPGTIDRDYAQEVKIPLTLLFGTSYWIHPGDRIAQARLVTDHPTTFRTGKVEQRGHRSGGFGSTGR